MLIVLAWYNSFCNGAWKYNGCMAGWNATRHYHIIMLPVSADKEEQRAIVQESSVMEAWNASLPTLWPAPCHMSNKMVVVPQTGPQFPHSPEPREWCPHQRRQQHTGYRSSDTDRRRSEWLFPLPVRPVIKCIRHQSASSYLSGSANIGQGHTARFSWYCIPWQEPWGEK